MGRTAYPATGGTDRFACRGYRRTDRYPSPPPSLQLVTPPRAEHLPAITECHTLLCSSSRRALSTRATGGACSLRAEPGPQPQSQPVPSWRSQRWERTGGVYAF